MTLQPPLFNSKQPVRRIVRQQHFSGCIDREDGRRAVGDQKFQLFLGPAAQIDLAFDHAQMLARCPTAACGYEAVKAHADKGRKRQNEARDAVRRRPGKGIERLCQSGAQCGHGRDLQSREANPGDEHWEQVEKAERNVHVHTPIDERHDADEYAGP